MVPPHQSFSSQLQRCKVSFVLLRARQHKGKEFCLYGLDPRLSFQGSSALAKVGGFIEMNWAYVVT
jgi:hypothetical protein